ncbi:MAG TPA: zf-HC2 domain-containing protein [Pyrinomonadaceae bacterium]|nr:zf-HC2 domain-containing protein [Pyrinomonadaceae bacterium]
MLCHEFEDQLTEYLDGTLDVEAHKNFAEHALRCPVCHDLLGDVKSTLVACSASDAPPAGPELEARILLKTVPETAITCTEFEEYLTDYLDGFLVAPLYHRWERHAALCDSCSELPGDVVRSIGACYTYKQDELTLPAGLEARILQSTIGNVLPRQVRAPISSRLVEWIRGALDPIVSPQLATVATMLLVAVFVLTNTVSTDGSVGGIYAATMQLAQKTADNATKSSVLPDGVKRIQGSFNDVIGNQKAAEPEDQTNRNQAANQNNTPQNSPSKHKESPEPKGR